MSKTSILDCTLRDGGYINNFEFGRPVITSIVSGLTKASIDIIECGFLASGANCRDCTVFGDIHDIQSIIAPKNPHLLYVAMIQYGAIGIDEIMECDGNSIDGIRITFHEHEIQDAFALAKAIMDKGYLVFIQPVGTNTYSDSSLIDLIKLVNTLTPYAFYIVDTLGTMYRKDILRLFYLVDHNLKENILIGFHSHNNLQLSFSNTQELLSLSTKRNIIIDASILGMGRGAGNLNTELIAQYVNTNIELKYDLTELLKIIENYIKPLTYKYKWGYNAVYYLAAINGCHPNYATYLLNKNTMHIQDIQFLLKNLDVKKKHLFNSSYIEDAYLHYMNHHVDDEIEINKIKHLINKKPVLLIAPGKSIDHKAKQLSSLIRSNKYYTISVNFLPADLSVDAIYISNMKRFENMTISHSSLINMGIQIIVTSNITTQSSECCFVVDYISYTNENPYIADNSGLMCINLLNKTGVKEILLVGFDGFSQQTEENYCDSVTALRSDSELSEKINTATQSKLVQLNTQLKIEFWDNSKYRLP